MEVVIGQTEPQEMASDDLRAEFVYLAEPLTVIANRRTALVTEIGKREQAANAAHRVSAMTDDEKAALRAALGA